MKENNIYLILGMKKRAESNEMKHSFFTVLDIAHGEKDAWRSYQLFKERKGNQYDGYIIANIVDISLTKVNVEFTNITPFDFLYKPVHRIDFPVKSDDAPIYP